MLKPIETKADVIELLNRAQAMADVLKNVYLDEQAEKLESVAVGKMMEMIFELNEMAIGFID